MRLDPASPTRFRSPPCVPLAVAAALIAASFALSWGVGVSLAADYRADVAGQAAPPIGPSGLRFYTPPRRLPAGPHGTLIWERAFHATAALPGARNALVLYKQIGVRGKIVAVSGIVAIPRGKPPHGGWPVVTYAHGLTGIADQCAPSRDTGPASEAYPTDVGLAPLFDRWIRNGYAVLRTDYEGLGAPGPHPFLIGRSEGHGVLDIVRAARQLAPALSRRVIIVGHSQGGHAALWATALAPRYTPDLHVLATVAFAPVSHLADEVSFLHTVNTPELTAGAALIVRGLDVAYPAQHLRSLLTPAALKLYPETLSRCPSELASKNSFGGLPLNQLLRQSADLTPIVRDLMLNDPDGLKIKAPVLLEQGLADQTVFPAFTQALSMTLASAGDSVTYHTYPGGTHSSVLAIAATDATAFLNKHFGH
jgi:pimeloyl-ACP methyl ester carboxylesterase